MESTGKRIALLGPAPPFRGGISQFALMLALEYAAQGCAVKMFTFERQYPDWLFPGGKQTTEFSHSGELDIAQVYTPYLPWSWNRAVQAIKSWMPDIILVSYFLPWFAPSNGWICRHLPGIRIVYLAHNVQAHEKWIGAGWLTRWMLKHSDRIVVLSRSVLDVLKNSMPLYISQRAVLGFHPLYEGYTEFQENSAVPERKAPTLLFFGLIKPYKGLDVLLKAMCRIQERLPEARLLIAGEVYGSSAQYEEQIRSLNLQRSLETHFRYIGENEIASFFWRSDVCVLPYKTATQSGVIATAYSFRVPVIASDVGGLSEYIENGVTGLLVAPDDPESLAEAILSYFQNGLQDTMSAQIPAFCARYSWKGLAELILKDL